VGAHRLDRPAPRGPTRECGDRLGELSAFLKDFPKTALDNRLTILVVESRMRRLLLLFVSLLLPLAGHANVTYSYVGNPYTHIDDLPFPAGTFDTSMRVSGSFELAAALPANLPMTDITGDVLGFSFANGRSTLNQNDLLLTLFFFVQTDAAGAISAWDVIVEQTLTLTAFGDTDATIATQNDTAGLLGLSGVQDRGQFVQCDPAGVPRGLCVAFADEATVDGVPGAWASSVTAPPVPEPTSAMLALAGLGWLGVALKRRRGASRA
jgi:hypothetical protein